MTRAELDRVQTYLRRLLGSDRITLATPQRAGQSVEVLAEDEVIGTLHRDDDEGEISYAIHLTVLEEDLPPMPKAGAAAPKRRAN